MRNLIICTVILLAGVLASSALAVDPNLVAWYTFDEGSGATVHDSAHGYNGTINGATWAAGKVGGGMSFDGVNDYIDVMDNSSLRFTQNSNFTLSAWVNPTAATGISGILGKFQTDSKKGLFTYDIEWFADTQNFGFGICSSGYSFVNPSTPTGSAPAGSWSHVACVYTNRNMEIYINGELLSTGYFPYETGTNTADNSLGIGARLVGYGAERYLEGSLDDIRIYNRALTAGEIKNIPEPTTIALLGLGMLMLKKRRA